MAWERLVGDGVFHDDVNRVGVLPGQRLLNHEEHRMVAGAVLEARGRQILVKARPAFRGRC